MDQFTPQTIADLEHSQIRLQDILHTLDQIGAGIAAIHVDAAIQQLSDNLQAFKAASLEAETPGNCYWIVPEPCDPDQHPVAL